MINKLLWYFSSRAVIYNRLFFSFKRVIMVYETKSIRSTYLVYKIITMLVIKNAFGERVTISYNKL